MTSTLGKSVENLASLLKEALSKTETLAQNISAEASLKNLSHADPMIMFLCVFTLAIFVGYYVVWKVTPALHSPLMAVTNAISSVIILGGLIGAGAASAASTFGLIAVFLASINIFGGFMVTIRMLEMFKPKK